LVIDLRTDLPDEQYGNLLKATSGKQAIALIHGANTTFLPAGHRASMTPLRALQYILITCSIPTLKEVSELRGEHVTIFRWCAGSEPFHWQDILTSPTPLHGVFFHLHGPSLKLVLSIHPEAEEFKVDDLPAISKAFGWQSIAWNPRNSDFEPLSAINTIVSYRLATPH
jgi:hypothetical protein